MTQATMPSATRQWTFRVRRGSDGDVIITIGTGPEMVMSEKQAETLGHMILHCCGGATNDTGEVRP